MPKVVVCCQFNGLFRGDQQDVNRRPAVHTEVSLCTVRLSEAIEHRLVHPFSIRPDLLVLQPGLDQVQGEHA